MRRFPYNLRLVLLTLFMLLLWMTGSFRIHPEADRLWNTIRTGQQTLWQKQIQAGVELSEDTDRLRTGFIGMGWSPLTTTLGGLEAKRTSANPLWATQFLDWFDDLGLRAGDKIVVYSSSSFPAMLFSAIAAAESRQLEILLAVSLGSSTWGANRPEFTWIQMSDVLREGGYIKTRPAFYTLGGAGENGREFSSDIARTLAEMSEREGTPLVTSETLEGIIRYKLDKLIEFQPKLFISIGGSNANLGDSIDAPDIPNGLLQPKNAVAYPADGVIAGALSAGIPAMNILNIKKLAFECHIPWDAYSFAKVRYSISPWVALLGLLVFFTILRTHKRWMWQDENND